VAFRRSRWLLAFRRHGARGCWSDRLSCSSGSRPIRLGSRGRRCWLGSLRSRLKRRDDAGRGLERLFGERSSRTGWRLDRLFGQSVRERMGCRGRSLRKRMGCRGRSLRKRMGCRGQSVRERMGCRGRSLRKRMGCRCRSLRQRMGCRCGSLRQRMGSRGRSMRKRMGCRCGSMRKRMSSRCGSMRQRMGCRGRSMRKRMGYRGGIVRERMRFRGQSMRKRMSCRDRSMRERMSCRGGSMRERMGSRGGSMRKRMSRRGRCLRMRMSLFGGNGRRQVSRSERRRRIASKRRDCSCCSQGCACRRHVSGAMALSRMGRGCRGRWGAGRGRGSGSHGRRRGGRSVGCWCRGCRRGGRTVCQLGGSVGNRVRLGPLGGGRDRRGLPGGRLLTSGSHGGGRSWSRLPGRRERRLLWLGSGSGLLPSGGHSSGRSWGRLPSRRGRRMLRLGNGGPARCLRRLRLGGVLGNRGVLRGRVEPGGLVVFLRQRLGRRVGPGRLVLGFGGRVQAVSAIRRAPVDHQLQAQRRRVDRARGVVQYDRLAEHRAAMRAAQGRRSMGTAFPADWQRVLLDVRIPDTRVGQRKSDPIGGQETGRRRTARHLAAFSCRAPRATPASRASRRRLLRALLRRARSEASAPVAQASSPRSLCATCSGEFAAEHLRHGERRQGDGLGAQDA
jgi:hypothetical protein